MKRFGLTPASVVAQVLLAAALSEKQTVRCDPTLDDRSLIDCTAVCARCGRRLTMEELGGGPPGGPALPLPVCQGAQLEAK